MQFGIFYEHQLPRPWVEDSEYRLLQEALEQVELADLLGIDYAWEGLPMAVVRLGRVPHVFSGTSSTFETLPGLWMRRWNHWSPSARGASTVHGSRR